MGRFLSKDHNAPCPAEAVDGDRDSIIEARSPDRAASLAHQSSASGRTLQITDCLEV